MNKDMNNEENGPSMHRIGTPSVHTIYCGFRQPFHPTVLNPVLERDDVTVVLTNNVQANGMYHSCNFY